MFIYIPDTVLDFLIELDNNRNYQRRAEEQLLGQIVLTTYFLYFELFSLYRYNNRTYRVDGIVWDMTPQSRFKKRTGQSFSYVEYYEQQYHKKLTAPNSNLNIFIWYLYMQTNHFFCINNEGKQEKKLSI